MWGRTLRSGVVPLGTANALAQNLGLGESPVKAMRLLLAATPTQVPVGRIFYRDSAGAEKSRYFTVAAGIGADALLMSRLDAELKRRLGYALYVVEAFQVWVDQPVSTFQCGVHRGRNAPKGGWKKCRSFWRCGFGRLEACWEAGAGSYAA